MPRVLVADPIHEDGLRQLSEFAEVEVSVGMTENELAAKIPTFDALVVRSATKVTRKVIESAKNLKVIARAGTGLDNIDVEAARERGVEVVNAPEAPVTAVAELVFALLLSLMRKIPEAHSSLKAGRWEKKKLVGSELNGKVMGILGTGRIGQVVAERAKAFGMQILLHDIFPNQEFAQRIGTKYVGLEELLSQSDVISIHIPLAPETKHIIGEREISLMKPSAILVNTSRGAVVDEQALAKALKKGKLAGACLDVYEREPPIGSPLLDCPNTILTPHIGASTVEAQRAAAVIIVDKIRAILQR